MFRCRFPLDRNLICFSAVVMACCGSVSVGLRMLRVGCPEEVIGLGCVDM